MCFNINIYTQLLTCIQIQQIQIRIQLEQSCNVIISCYQQSSPYQCMDVLIILHRNKLKQFKLMSLIMFIDDNTTVNSSKTMFLFHYQLNLLNVIDEAITQVRTAMDVSFGTRL